LYLSPETINGRIYGLPWVRKFGIPEEFSASGYNRLMSADNDLRLVFCLNHGEEGVKEKRTIQQ